ncbi:MAG TPA: hypothetical protein VMA77_09115 [Solirubrobacteraceae bacterium]|nr:hypothetical protein [Solirubrobacteraceae bacterium]
MAHVRRLEAERERLPGLVEFIEENEPRLLACNEYANEEGTEVGVPLVVKPYHLGGFTRTPTDQSAR